MNRRVIAAIAGLTLAAVGTFSLVAFVRGAEDRAIAGEKLVDVLVVTNRIAPGTPVADIEGDVEPKEVPAKVRAEDAVSSLDQLEGRLAGIELLPGEQLTNARFVEPDVFARTRAEVQVPEGALEVTVSLDPERAVGGVLRPGATVAVLASFDPFDISSTQPVQLEGLEIPEEGQTPNSTKIIQHKVLVTNVQTATQFDTTTDDSDSATAPAPQDQLLVTFARVEPGDVEKIVFAAEHGRIWLAVQPEEASERGSQVQTRGSIYE